MSQAFSRALALYARPRLLAILLMGFASGLPLLLTGATLSFWLAESKVSLASIGAFALVGSAYSLKFLWSPLLDRLSLPWLTQRLGRRRSWMLVIQLGLMISIAGLGLTDPAVNAGLTALWAVAVAFCSASQDIVIDAFRVELLAGEEQGAGAAVTQIGYRLGIIAAGAGALFLATWLGWHAAYLIMAGLVLVGSATVLASPEPRVSVATPQGNWLKTTIIAPFIDFARHRHWLALLIFVVLYRLGDAVAGHMAAPFYQNIGFTRNEYGEISKLYGVVASIIGVSLGGMLVYRLGVMRTMLLAGALQILSNLSYILQYWAGHDLLALTLTIGFENIVIGMAGAGFVAYLSSLCSPGYTATQYALLSSLATVAPRLLGSAGGAIAADFGWPAFFLLSAVLIVPALVLLVWLMRQPAESVLH